VSVRSFADYRNHIRRITKDLKPIAALRFCNWCIERFQRMFGDEVWDSLTPDERVLLAGFISELRATESLEEVMRAERAEAIIRQIEAFGPHDEIAAIEILPDAIGFRELVWSTLEYCRTRNMAQVYGVSEEMMNSIDHHREDTHHYGLDNMFCAPSLAEELRLQTEFIKNL
jgi:hypothetical protein